MVATVRAASFVRAVTTTADNGDPSQRNVNPPARRLLSVPNPRWVVRTESNVRKEKRPKPDPPCVVCKGSGRVDCYDCRGRGRTNHIELPMLPKGEWPKWCRSCGGSGLGYCSRCVGTGEYRYIMGFQFMKKDSDQVQDTQRYQVGDKQSSYSFTELLLNADQPSSESKGGSEMAWLVVKGLARELREGIILAASCLWYLYAVIFHLLDNDLNCLL